jgi:Meiotically up-regulated gene 113
MLKETLSWCPVDRPGYVYLAQIHHMNNEWGKSKKLYKIGHTEYLKRRIYDLRCKWKSEVEYIAFSPVKDKINSEMNMHKKYNRYLLDKPMGYSLDSSKEYFLFEDCIINEVITDIWYSCDRSNFKERTHENMDKLLNAYRENEELKLKIKFLEEEIEVLKNK